MSLNHVFVVASALAISLAAHGQTYDWQRDREVDARERAARAAERLAAAAERQADIARWERIERCFERGEHEQCLAMMDPFEQNKFIAMESSQMAGRGLGHAIAAVAGSSSQHEDAIARLRALHPDYEQIVADPSFRRWVNESPTRKEMLAKAHAEYDVAAADMLFSTWKRLRSR